MGDESFSSYGGNKLQPKKPPDPVEVDVAKQHGVESDLFDICRLLLPARADRALSELSVFACQIRVTAYVCFIFQRTAGRQLSCAAKPRNVARQLTLTLKNYSSPDTGTIGLIAPAQRQLLRSIAIVLIVMICWVSRGARLSLPSPLGHYRS